MTNGRAGALWGTPLSSRRAYRTAGLIRQRIESEMQNTHKQSQLNAILKLLYNIIALFSTYRVRNVYVMRTLRRAI